VPYRALTREIDQIMEADTILVNEQLQRVQRLCCDVAVCVSCGDLISAGTKLFPRQRLTVP
jgi:hypothetical protein